MSVGIGPERSSFWGESKKSVEEEEDDRKERSKRGRLRNH
jgi:hypothetical protein